MSEVTEENIRKLTEKYENASEEDRDALLDDLGCAAGELLWEWDDEGVEFVS